MNTEDYQFITKVVKEKSGIDLGHDRMSLVSNRLEHLLGKYKVSTITELVSLFKNANNITLLNDIISALTTNETFFFRDTRPFTLLEKELLPKIIDINKNSKKLSIWSAACSQGQEPYSIAIILQEKFPELSNWNVEIVATDIDENVIEYAKDATYSRFEVNRGLSKDLQEKYLEQHESKWKIDSKTRNMVNFKVLNLLDIKELTQKFDIIFCRNVLIYFDKPTKNLILENLQQNMYSHTPLILGGAETTVGINNNFERIYAQETSYFQLKSTL